MFDIVKRKHFSLSGTIAIIHLSIFLLLVICSRALHGHYWEHPHLIDFIHTALWILISPFGLLVAEKFTTSHIDVWVSVIVVAANSTFIGFVLASIVRRLLSSFAGNTPQHPTTLAPEK